MDVPDFIVGISHYDFPCEGRLCREVVHVLGSRF